MRHTMEFLEKRLAGHKRWQEEASKVLMQEIIDEVMELPRRAPRRNARLFDELPLHVQASIVIDLEPRQ